MLWSGDGLLSWSEFEQLLEDPKLRFLLDKLEIAAGDACLEIHGWKQSFCTFAILCISFQKFTDHSQSDASCNQHAPQIHLHDLRGLKKLWRWHVMCQQSVIQSWFKQPCFRIAPSFIVQIQRLTLFEVCSWT